MISMTGCISTLIHTVGGTIMGAPSLTNKLYQSDSSVGIKIFSTPFAIPTGVVGGFGFGVYYGIKEDVKLIGINSAGVYEPDRIYDPFKSGLFYKRPQQQMNRQAKR